MIIQAISGHKPEATPLKKDVEKAKEEEKNLPEETKVPKATAKRGKGARRGRARGGRAGRKTNK